MKPIKTEWKGYKTMTDADRKQLEEIKLHLGFPYGIGDLSYEDAKFLISQLDQAWQELAEYKDGVVAIQDQADATRKQYIKNIRRLEQEKADYLRYREMLDGQITRLRTENAELRKKLDNANRVK
ncbi:hypothetical protein D4S03_10125 [bacterium]|nr:MAG: hypothetical protein D4S03_10125 [bacterium]